MLVLGLTGGIGAGKSAVSSLLRERGAALVDADVVAREVVATGTPGLAAVAGAFGPSVLAADGSLDRAALAGLVFGEDEARARLNGIVHPLIGERTAELFAEADSAPYLVHDVPLLVENGLAPAYHLVAVVQAPRELRLSRLAARGLAPDSARSRMAAQASDADRAAVADVLLDNGSSREGLAAAVARLHDERLLPYAANLQAGRRAPRPDVSLAPPDARWVQDGARLMARLRHLAPAAVAVGHIGSTAVPGLPAKDVVDLQVEVADEAQVEALGKPLSAGGFVLLAGIDGDPVRPPFDPSPAAWRKRVHVNADPGRACNVHVRVAGSAGARLALAFRDALRADDALRDRYAELKRGLAARFPGDVDAYSEGKTDFVLAAVGR